MLVPVAAIAGAVAAAAVAMLTAAATGDGSCSWHLGENVGHNITSITVLVPGTQKHVDDA